MRRLLLGLIIIALGACSQPEEAGADTSWNLSQQNFLEEGFVPKVGDQVWVRVFDATGDEVVFEKYDITNDNINTWRSDLALSLNAGKSGEYLQARDNPNELGLSNVSTNYIWLNNPEFSYVMGLSH